MLAPVLLILVAAASRFLPHPPNVTCLAAMGLLAGCYFQSRWRYVFPLAALLVSDGLGQILAACGFPFGEFGMVGTGFYEPTIMLTVYGGIMLSVPLGGWISRQSGWKRIAAIPTASVIASTVFFILSNLGVIAAGWYPWSIDGLAACFTAAIPFYRFTLAGDVVFSAVFFGVTALNFRMTQSYAEIFKRSRFLSMARLSFSASR